MGASATKCPLGEKLDFTTVSVTPILAGFSVKFSSGDSTLLAMAPALVSRTWTGEVKENRSLVPHTLEFELTIGQSRQRAEDPIETLVLNFARILTRLGWRLLLNCNLTIVFKTVVIVFQKKGGSLPLLMSMTFSRANQTDYFEATDPAFNKALAKELSFLTSHRISTQVYVSNGPEPTYRVRGLSRENLPRPQDAQVKIGLMKFYQD